jgi:hypothetical protein
VCVDDGANIRVGLMEWAWMIVLIARLGWSFDDGAVGSGQCL